MWERVGILQPQVFLPKNPTLSHGMEDIECSFLFSPSQNGDLSVSGHSQSGKLNNSNTNTVSNAGFFYRFLSNTKKWICRILEFRKKILEFRNNFLSLGDKNCYSIGKNCYFCLKITKNCRIFKFRRKICLSLAKNC